MQIEQLPISSYWKVSDYEDTEFLGSRKQKGKDYIMVEDNLANRVILDVVEEPTSPELLHLHGLMPYQVKDVTKMCTYKYILNRNPMGYGKTVETIYAMRNVGVTSALIIVPKTIRIQWQSQIDYWWPNNPGVSIFPDMSQPIVILNYEKLLNEQNLTKFKSRRWDLIVADEAHKIKNRKSKTSVAIKSIPSNRRWALTGTPILRKPDDLFSILEFLTPDYSGKSYWNFVNYFCEIKEGFFGRDIVGLTKNEEHLKVWNRIIDMVTVHNPDMNLTPGKVVNTILLEMDKEQKSLYNKVKNLVLEELPEELTIPNGAVLCARLQQVTSNPAVLPGGKTPGVKFEYILDVLENNPEEKFVVFTKFAKVAKNLSKYLESHKIKSTMYIGEMNTVERNESLIDFRNNPETRVFVATIGAAGVGLDGLQHASRHAICLERDWSPEIMKQVEDRLNRPGQKHIVQISVLECAKTYDQKVGKINIHKSEDIRRALND